MVLVLKNGLMELLLKVNIKKEKNMEKVSLFGVREVSLKGILSKIAYMALGCIFGKMEGSIWEIG